MNENLKVTQLQKLYKLTDRRKRQITNTLSYARVYCEVLDEFCVTLTYLLTATILGGSIVLTWILI